MRDRAGIVAYDKTEERNSDHVKIYVPPVDDDDEKDPLGIDQHSPGAKLDDGKTQADELLGMFANAIEEVLRVGQFGADKYSLGGWQHVPEGEKRYANAMLRHWIKRKKGEEFDTDSGLLHLAHEAWNALAILELRMRSTRME